MPYKWEEKLERAELIVERWCDDHFWTAMLIMISTSVCGAVLFITLLA